MHKDNLERPPFEDLEAGGDCSEGQGRRVSPNLGNRHHASSACVSEETGGSTGRGLRS